MRKVHLIDRKHHDEVMNTRRTACGLQGYPDHDTNDVIVDGRSLRVTSVPANTTCEACKPKVGKLSPPMLRMLKWASIEDLSTFKLRGKKRSTYRALFKRGLINAGKTSERGKEELQKRGKP